MFHCFLFWEVLNIRYTIKVFESKSIKSSFYARHYAKGLGFSNV